MMLNFNNMDKKNKSFMYQNLQRSKCFNTNFGYSNFDYACFRGAHMKNCRFNDCTFKGTEFMGSNMKESQFRNASFENAVFEGAKLEGVDFKGAKFKNTIFVATNLDTAMNLDLQDPNIRVFSEMPELDMSSELRTAVESLMKNAFVRKSRVLDTKEKTMNTVSVMILLEMFGEAALIENLAKVESALDRDFYTLSYIIKILEKNVSNK